MACFASSTIDWIAAVSSRSRSSTDVFDARTDAHRSMSPASRSRSSMSGTVRSRVVTTE